MVLYIVSFNYGFFQIYKFLKKLDSKTHKYKWCNITNDKRCYNLFFQPAAAPFCFIFMDYENRQKDLNI